MDVKKTLMLMACIATGAPGALQAQTWPATHVRIVTAGAGGGSDFAARLIAPKRPTYWWCIRPCR
ncbi:MAG: hypothetical protein EBT83_15735 [Betaproteobacteria bacterium]|nr:hypothetical protein [Betaproteobacteria bacterium]